MSDLDLLYTDVEDDLRTTVRGLLADHCEPGAVTALYDGDRAIVDGLWKALAVDLGLAGLLVPEEQGGAGASAREAAVVLEELGRYAAPVPFLTSSVVATTVLLEPGLIESGLLGSDHPLLGRLATGERTAALVVPLSTAPDGPLPAVSAAADGRLTGSVPATQAGIAPVVSLDMTRQLADVALDGVAAELVVPDADHAVRRGLEAGAALLASEQAGVAGWCLDTTVAYLKERRQFGRVVGGFQALKHRLADLYAGVESAHATARHAAAALAAGDDDVPVAASVAQAFCSDLAVLAAEEAVQLHGGIGMTWEHPAHLYLKRAKADQIAFGTAGAHRARLATLVDLPGVEA